VVPGGGLIFFALTPKPAVWCRRVNACIEWCREAGVADAEAYLLEHYLGDYAAALQICLAQVDRCAAHSLLAPSAS